MQHDTTKSETIVEQTSRSLRDLVDCLNKPLTSLGGGEYLGNIIPYKSLPCYVDHSFNNNGAGGAASALRDVALLLISVDTSVFASQCKGFIREDIIQYLDGALHLWLSAIYNQWQYVKQSAVNGDALLAVPIPPPEQEKATLSTMFQAVCHSLHIGPIHPSPFINQAALNFASSFRAKLWPFASAQTLTPSSDQKCPIREMSILFQEWYFSIGQTQIDKTSARSVREAGDIFVSIRGGIIDQANQCRVTPDNPCQGNCAVSIAEAHKDHPFGARCYESFLFLAERLSANAPY